MASTPNIVTSTEWRQFWISFDNDIGKLEVGLEGHEAFMTYIDPTPLNIMYWAYATGQGGAWQLRVCDQGKQIHIH